MKKVETYKFNEFYNQNEVKKINRQIEMLKRDKNKYLAVVFILALILDPSLVYADKIASYGGSILMKIQIYMGIVASIMCSIELATELVKGGRGYFQILFKYGSGYVALILCPTIFEIIKSLF